MKSTNGPTYAGKEFIDEIINSDFFNNWTDTVEEVLETTIEKLDLDRDSLDEKEYYQQILYAAFEDDSIIDLYLEESFLEEYLSERIGFSVPYQFALLSFTEYEMGSFTAVAYVISSKRKKVCCCVAEDQGLDMSGKGTKEFKSKKELNSMIDDLISGMNDLTDSDYGYPNGELSISHLYFRNGKWKEEYWDASNYGYISNFYIEIDKKDYKTNLVLDEIIINKEKLKIDTPLFEKGTWNQKAEKKLKRALKSASPRIVIDDYKYNDAYLQNEKNKIKIIIDIEGPGIANCYGLRATITKDEKTDDVRFVCRQDSF